MRPSMRLVLLLAAIPSLGRAQGVVPGVTIQVDRTPGEGPDTVVFQRSITRAGRDTSSGTRTVVRRVVDSPDGTPLLTVEQRFPWGGGEIVDTAIADLATLRAVAHRSHQPLRTMRFDFVGTVARGTVSATGAGDSTVEQDLQGAIFDSNVLDLVVAALPLAPGFSAELPFFIYERGGRVSMPVAVKERSQVAFAKLGTRDVWVVTVGVPDAPATIWVDAKTRAVLRVRYEIASRGLAFTDDRITPLRG